MKKEIKEIKEFKKFYDNGAKCAEVVNRMNDFFDLYLSIKARTPSMDGLHFWQYCIEYKVLKLCGSGHVFDQKIFGTGGNSGQICLNERTRDANLIYWKDNKGNVNHKIYYVNTPQITLCNDPIWTHPSDFTKVDFSALDITDNAEEVYFQFSTLVPLEYINLYAFYSALHLNLKTQDRIEINNLSTAFLNNRLKEINKAIDIIQESFK